MLFVRQFRHGTQTETLELPGGSTEARDPSPLESARRELLEETGYVSECWRAIGVVDPNPAIQSNACHTFLARDVRKVAEPAPDGAEDLAVELLSPEEVSRRVGLPAGGGRIAGGAPPQRGRLPQAGARHPPHQRRR
ncbi:MAG: NUDIX hydrolase [Acidobacteria bacterium ACB2]|nr:NUDIX hydrolase [Acidobacteria bacterium ACB2]